MYLHLELKSATKYNEDPYYLVNQAKITALLDCKDDIDEYKVGEILYYSDKDRYHMHIIKAMKVITKDEFDTLKTTIEKGDVKIDSHYYIIKYEKIDS